jgi:hypothetical protein
MKNKKADICQEIVDGQSYVYVLDKKGKRCFCREKTAQTLAIAHAIYMYEKYGHTHNFEKIVAWGYVLSYSTNEVKK